LLLDKSGKYLLMRIRDAIQDHLRKRARGAGCLVVYDEAGRYRELALGLADERLHVVDASGSSIEAREAAHRLWRRLAESAHDAEESLLIYVPARRPLDESGQLADPFQAFALAGAVFPAGEGDAYQSLCVQAKPDQVDRIYELFDSGAEPSFETVDALDGGATWPKLGTLLGAESPREILVALLSPSQRQRDALLADTSWLGEYRRLAEAVLGLTAHAKLASLDEVQAELARFVLFSEFALDLPGPLPDALAGVPRADERRRNLVYAVCGQLRDARAHEDAYVAHANRVCEDLALEAHMSETRDFGVRDTFLFEERAFLRRCADAAAAGDLETARRIARERERSIWVRAEERGAAWTIAGRALDLLQAISDLEGEARATSGGVAALVGFYADCARRVDTLHRTLDRTVHDDFGQAEGLDPLVDEARARYRRFADDLQKRFVDAVQAEGWPVSGFTRHTRVFQAHVAPALERNCKVALFMVDALRYEMAAEFVQRLPADAKADLKPALAQVPTITPVGMAALLPGADGELSLDRDGGELVPRIGERSVRTPSEREAHARRVYGDRCAMVDLDALLRARKPKIPNTVDLLLVKSTEIDAAGENLAGGAGLVVMRGVLEKLLRALRAVRELGFHEAVIASDHGFVLLSEQLPGDKVQRPGGEWPLSKVRCAAGKGGDAPGSIRFRPEDLGVRGELDDIVVPATLGAYTTGATFMHSGLSLQECVIPVLRIDLGEAAGAGRSRVQLQVTYRGGKTNRITTRRPMIEVALFQAEMFGEQTVQFSLEARAGKKVVGEPAPAACVDPTTGLVQIEAGGALKVALRMEEGFEGAFTVVAVDPVTQVIHDSLDLETDYVE